MKHQLQYIESHKIQILVIHPCKIFDGIQRSMIHFAVVLPSFIRIQVQTVGSPDTISLSSAPYIKYVSEKPVLHVVPSIIISFSI